MKCPKCNGRGKTTEYDGLRKFWCDYKCDACNGTGEVMTEQEWLQTADTEQLAEWLAHHSRFVYECGKKQITPKTMYEENWEWWLKQPHTK